ncbi:imm11 family protein [Burkholderia vietnamiensis]|uniref:imm11 family protein n=1 Tax=Burkholderia vietnamiensis TaxID=60552 RepID=UPI0039BF3D65
MSDKFFEIGLDYNDSSRWYLGQPSTGEGKVLPGTFRDCIRWSDSRPLTVEIRQAGMPATFNHSGHAIYILTAELIDSLASVVDGDTFQAIPVSVEGSSGAYKILNVLDCVDCVDEQNSEFSRWSMEDGRPELVGNYRMSLLRIDPKRARGHDLFRVKGWNIALVCSERVKEFLESVGVTGIRFKPAVHNQCSEK